MRFSPKTASLRRSSTPSFICPYVQVAIFLRKARMHFGCIYHVVCRNKKRSTVSPWLWTMSMRYIAVGYVFIVDVHCQPRGAVPSRGRCGPARPYAPRVCISLVIADQHDKCFCAAYPSCRKIFTMFGRPLQKLRSGLEDIVIFELACEPFTLINACAFWEMATNPHIQAVGMTSWARWSLVQLPSLCILITLSVEK